MEIWSSITCDIPFPVNLLTSQSDHFLKLWMAAPAN